MWTTTSNLLMSLVSTKLKGEKERLHIGRPRTRAGLKDQGVVLSSFLRARPRARSAHRELHLPSPVISPWKNPESVEPNQRWSISIAVGTSTSFFRLDFPFRCHKMEGLEVGMAKKVSSDEQGLPSLSLVFGYVAVKELQRIEDRVRVLARLGYGNPAIAQICDTSLASVRTLKHVANKKRISKKKRGATR
jgi:hypothetical protein